MSIKRLRVIASLNMSFHWFTIGIIVPVMTLFLIEKGLTLAQVGISFAVYSAATVILEIPTGGLADTVGRKKVYLISLLFQIIGAILLLFVWSFSALLVCFVFQGISRSLSSGTMDAHFIDEFYRLDPEVNLQEEMAKIGTFIPLGIGFGSLLGGFLPMTLGVLTQNGALKSLYAANYVVLIITVILQMIMTTLFVKEQTDREEDNSLVAGFRKVPEVLKTSMKYGIGHPVILILLIATFIWGFSISGLEQFWQPQVKSIINENTGSWIYGLLTTGYFFAASVGSLIAIPFCRLFKNNYSITLFVARLLMGALYIILAIQTKIIPFAFFYITLFMFNGVQSSPEQSVFNSAVPSDKRSTLLSFSSLFLQLGGIMGSVFLGFIAHNFSIKTAWIIASLVITSSAVLYLLIPHLKSKREIK